MKHWVVAATGLVVFGLAGWLPVGGGSHSARNPVRREGMDLSAYSPRAIESSLRLLFVHHSCGGELFASPGQAQGDSKACIYRSHPNGGNLRSLLGREGYEVHEASYGSQIGQDTDLFDWLPKFRDSMPRVLATFHQDETYRDARPNDVVVFKSCFTNSDFVGEGHGPGTPEGPALTVSNAKAALRALLPIFHGHPSTLFVYMTSPPSAPNLAPVPAWKWLARAAMRRPQPGDVLAQRADLAREFHNWAKAPDGWLSDYSAPNVVVFDYFDVLTGSGGNLSAYPTGNGLDSHPSSEGNQRAAQAFIPFLNRAVRRAGLAPLNSADPKALR
jgi:hypothetical protein